VRLYLSPKIIRVCPSPEKGAALCQVAEAVVEDRAEEILLRAEVVLNRRVV
jgi:hypothetical protein